MGLFDWFKKKPPTPQEELQGLLRSGAVKQVYIRPPSWGGEDAPHNITWLPPAVIAEKEAFEAELEAAVQRGVSVQYSAHLEYEGASEVPVRVVLAAEGDDLDLRKTIEVNQYRTW